MTTNLSLFLVVIFLCSFLEQTIAQRNVCPPWFIPDNTSSTGCSCRQHDSKVYCRPDFPLVHFGYCMTYNNTNGATEYGPHPYIGHCNTTNYVAGDFYIQLLSNVALLNKFMCGPLNQEGPLCGKCKDGYGIALYSYTREYSKCWGHGYGWILYYFLELFDNCDVLSGGDLPQKSHHLPTECPCVHESGYSIATQYN